MKPIAYVSVDVEASGPLPPDYDLLSVGAVVVHEEEGGWRFDPEEFYVELKPRTGREDPEAMAVHGLDPERLRREGLDPDEAARRFDRFVRERCAAAREAVFVGYCANFDWAYVNDLFYRAGVANPFGYKALDLRSFAFGVLGWQWDGLRQSRLVPALGLRAPGPGEAHHALADARHQARMLVKLLERSRAERRNRE